MVAHGQEPHVNGMLGASPASTHELLLNIRAEGEPSALQRIVDTQLRKLPGTWEAQYDAMLRSRGAEA